MRMTEKLKVRIYIDCCIVAVATAKVVGGKNLFERSKTFCQLFREIEEISMQWVEWKSEEWALFRSNRLGCRDGENNNGSKDETYNRQWLEWNKVPWNFLKVGLLKASFIPVPPGWSFESKQETLVPPAPKILYAQIPLYLTGLTTTPVIVDMIKVLLASNVLKTVYIASGDFITSQLFLKEVLQRESEGIRCAFERFLRKFSED